MHKSQCFVFLNVLVTELQGVTYGHSSSDSSLIKAQQQSVNFQQQPTGKSDQSTSMHGQTIRNVDNMNAKSQTSPIQNKIGNLRFHRKNTAGAVLVSN